MNSLNRLHSLRKNLIRSNKLGEYDKIIQKQINEGIFERRPVEMKKLGGATNYEILYKNFHFKSSKRLKKLNICRRQVM